jgi:hypothetical protein
MTSITVHVLDCDVAHLNSLEKITAKYHQHDEVFRNCPRRYDLEINEKPNSGRDRDRADHRALRAILDDRV